MKLETRCVDAVTRLFVIINHINLGKCQSRCSVTYFVDWNSVAKDFRCYSKTNDSKVEQKLKHEEKACNGHVTFHACHKHVRVTQWASQKYQKSRFDCTSVYIYIPVYTRLYTFRARELYRKQDAPWLRQSLRISSSFSSGLPDGGELEASISAEPTPRTVYIAEGGLPLMTK